MEITRKIILLFLVFSLLQVIGLPTLEVTAQSSLSNLTIVSPQNKTYNSQLLTLNATIDFVMARIESMSYNIDGLGRYSFFNHFHSEDSTIIHGTQIWLAGLPELAEGSHFITVYLEGTLYFEGGNHKQSHYSEQATVYFTIDNTPSSPSPSPSPEPTIEPESFPTSLVMASSIPVAVVLVGLGLLLYFIKRQ